MRGLRRSTQRARNKGKIAQGAAIQMNHFLLNVEMSEWRSSTEQGNTDHATSLCRTLAGATELPWANGRITCALGWIERNMWRGTFFKRFCQIGQLGGDAIPVV